MQIPDLFLGALFPVVFTLVDWLKGIPIFSKTKPVVLSVSISLVLTTIYYVLPEPVQQYILTVAIPVGTAAVFYEWKKVSDGMKQITDIQTSGMPDDTIPEDPTLPQ